MTDFNITATHLCGHTEQHTGGTASGDIEGMLAFFATRKCSTCRPMCAFCNRTGDRENMYVIDNGATFCNRWCYQQTLNPTHFCEHNGIAIPGFLSQWLDMSYHNDLCARSELKMGKDAVTIWVDFENPADREDPSCSRFNVVFCRDGEFNMEDRDMLYMGDDAAVAAQWARAAEDVASGAPPDDDVAAMVLRIHELINTPEEN